jgi:hypothetical protein
MERMSNNNSAQKPTQAGFTIIELLIIAPIVLLTIGAFITAIVNMTGDVLASRGATVLTYNIQDALNRIEDDVKLSTTFLATNNITLTSPQGYSDDTTAFNNVDATNGTMLILNTLATNGNPLVSTSGSVYLTNLPNACNSTQLSQNTPMTVNIVYFVRNATLWRRTIMPSSYATAGCSVPWQQPSCNPALFTGGSWGSYTFCNTQDIRLVDNITTGGFAISYFNTADATIPNTVASDGSSSTSVRNSALQSLTTVGASISVSTTAGGRPISQSGSIRVTKLDINASTIAPAVTNATPAAPTGVSATFNLPGQVTVSWYPNASSYTLQYDTTSSFSSPTTISNIISSSQAVTGLNKSPQYYFRVSSTNSAGTSGLSSTVSSSTTITNGLVVWWPFNGNANDISGGGYNGSIIGASLTTGQNGQANGAYNFTASVNTITSSTIPAMQTTQTMSAWIKPSATPSERYTIMEGITPSGAYYLSMNTDNSLQIYWYDTSNPGYHSSGASTIPLNVWTYVTSTWDGTNARLYVNGVLKTTVAVTGVGRAAANLIVGAEAPARQYLGVIDDVRLYSRALSDSEVLGLYNDGAR